MGATCLSTGRGENRVSEIKAENFQDAMLAGRVEDCRAFLQRLFESEGRSPEYLYQMVFFHYRQSAFVQAAMDYQELLGLDLGDRIAKVVDQRSYFFDCCSQLGWFGPAREVADRIAAWCDPPSAVMVRAGMLWAMGLDDEAAEITSPFERDDRGSIFSQLFLLQCRLRRTGISAAIDAYARSMTAPRARETVCGVDAGYPMSAYWHGQKVLPRRLVLRPRGGIGDTLLWARYLPFLQAAGVETLVENLPEGISLRPLEDPGAIAHARERLADWSGTRAEETMWTDPFALLTGMFPLFGYADAPAGWLRTSSAPFADEQLKVIRDRANGRPCVAVAWSSNESPWFASRSLTLDQMHPLLAMDEVHWVVCQRGQQRQAWADLPQAAASTLLPTDFTLNQTGVVLRGLDAAVVNDGVLVHLSSGLDLPTFLLASAVADWRWEDAASTSHWSARTRLVRQPALGDWDGAVGRLKSELIAWNDRRSAGLF